MKGLRKYLTPFAPDQSGAVSMCYALGGMVVIVDAGGCAGNICGFDEPRWQPDYDSSHFSKKLTPECSLPKILSSGQEQTLSCERVRKPGKVGAVFSAGLRDMDAILGRDEALVGKVNEACRKIDVSFIALIGTPVPAVIGTDLHAAARMAEKATHLPCIAISTDGMHLYDRGIRDALLALVRAFSGNGDSRRQEASEFSKNTDSRSQEISKFSGNADSDGQEVSKGRRICGVLGLNPLDLFDPKWTVSIRSALYKKGYDEVLLLGMEGGLDAFSSCHLAEKNYVISPAGIAAAQYLEKEFGTPYEVCFPADPFILLEEDPAVVTASLRKDARILVIHQQVLANAIRDSLRETLVQGTITAATWFDLEESLSQEGDIRLREEDDFIFLAKEGNWDLIIADPALKPMADSYQGAWIDAFHFAVSGQAAIDNASSRRQP